MNGFRSTLPALIGLALLAGGCRSVDDRYAKTAGPGVGPSQPLRTLPAVKIFPLKPGQPLTATTAQSQSGNPADNKSVAVPPGAMPASRSRAGMPMQQTPNAMPASRSRARTPMQPTHAHAAARRGHGTLKSKAGAHKANVGAAAVSSFDDATPAAGAVRLTTNDESKSTTTTVRQIDLPTSLALVAGQSPQVAFVQERVREASARLQAAEALWLPSVRVGVSYNKHEGNLQDVAGEIINVSRGSTFRGLGARAVGAGSPAVPGLYSQFHLADAIFQPIVAERTVSARQHGVSATTNNELLRSALAYTELVEAAERKQIAGETLAELKKLADLTASFAKRGQGTQADADRAKTELQLQTNVVTRAEEALRVASAKLSEVLNLDAGEVLQPVEGSITPVDLVSATDDVAGLVTRAYSSRPELCENQFEIDAAWNRYKRERYSPLVPNVGVGVSYGGYAGGVGDTIANDRDRFDFDALLYWEVRNLGLGERAARQTAKSRMHQTQYRRTKLAAVIRREVATAHARVASASKQIEQAEASVKSANASMTRNFQRIREAKGLPLEVLQSIQALDAAKRERLNARAAYNRAQFELHRAIGWPAGP